MKRALLFANTEWYLYNFRLSLARALQAAGYVFTSRSIKALVLCPMVRLALRLALGGKRAASDPFRIVLPARLLCDKGIAEWVTAAEKLKAWHAAGTIEWLVKVDDMPAL